MSLRSERNNFGCASDSGKLVASGTVNDSFREKKTFLLVSISHFIRIRFPIFLLIECMDGKHVKK